MSSIPQTAAADHGDFLRGFALRMGVIALILVAALAAYGRQMLALMIRGHLHAPNLTLFATQSPVIKLHLLAALAALTLGAALMWARKGRRFHRVAGWTWAALVATVAGSSLFITSLNHGRWSLIHLLTGWTLLILPLAVIWARRHDVARHRRAMMGLFYGGFAINLFIAFMPGRILWRLFFA
jgi:uncharacterized membrane protein